MKDRLETVRELMGCDTLTSWAALVNGAGFKASYEALRQYHREGRAPPVSYLVRIHEFRGISLAWLCTGKGAAIEVKA